MFHFEICTPEGRGGEKGVSANIKTKHTEHLTQGLTPVGHLHIVEVFVDDKLLFIHKSSMFIHDGTLSSHSDNFNCTKT